jgi:hypothetical protein
VSALSQTALAFPRPLIVAALSLCLAGHTLAQARPVSPFVIERFESPTTPAGGLVLDPLLLRVLGPASADELFAIGGEDGGVEYVPGEGEIRLETVDQLACFDRAPVAFENTRIIGLGGSGWPAIDLYNAPSLGFSPDFRVVNLETSYSAPCFWEVADGVESDLPFTLFGQPVLNQGPSDRIFSDGFEPGVASIAVSYPGFPAQLGINESFTYQIRIENVGNVAIDNLGLRELFVGNPQLGNAVFNYTPGSLQCFASAGAVCGDVITEIELGIGQFIQLPYFRSDFGDGTSLAPDSHITLSVQRRVIPGVDDQGQPLSPLQTIGEVVELTTVALSLDDSSTNVPWSSARVSAVVVANGFIGATGPVEPVIVSDLPNEQITIQAFQPNEQPLEIAGLTINGVPSNENAAVTPGSQATDSEGMSTFDINSQEAGTVRFTFTATELVEGGQPASVFFDVEFVAADAAELRFEGPLDPAYGAGSSIPGPQVCAVDEFGNVASDQNGSNVVLSLYQNEKPVSVIETLPLVEGCTTFSDVSLAQYPAGTGYLLFAQRGINIDGASTVFSIIEPQ